jgi:hypothetical protein
LKNFLPLTKLLLRLWFLLVWLHIGCIITTQSTYVPRQHQRNDYHVLTVLLTQVDVESVGVPPGILGPWKAALRHTKEADALIKEGYKKYSKDGKFFKIASIPRYLVFPTDPKHLQEMNSAPDHVLSFGDAGADVRDTFQSLGS